ncbi:hypothetical protein [Cellvibrio mixtus]|uniref:hypothetical protein n=1 Tax=Cellvibrio mixtus TaxID=39650 RepID=UPI0005866158|nr:hypothetical protein [Cellvibrio mixtus]
MRGTRYWAARCLAVITLVISLPASAHLVFTYTSNELPLTAYTINGYPENINDYKDILPLAFSYSFTVPEQDLSLQPSTTFRFTDFTFSLISPIAESIIYYTLDLTSSRSGGWVTLDQSGNITGWNVMLRMTELITPETNLFFHRLSNNFIAVKSSSEDGDKLSNRFHPSTWHGYYIQLAKIQMSYSGASNFNNWTIERVAVPEAGSAGLLVMGLSALFWLRGGRKNILSLFGR